MLMVLQQAFDGSDWLNHTYIVAAAVGRALPLDLHSGGPLQCACRVSTDHDTKHYPMASL